jgi:DNA primase
MAGRIPDQFIDELLSRADIVEVIGSRLELKRAGSNLQALCPFHNEKSPSFTVSPSKQFYHCFGCGAHGTAIRFLMEYDRMEFRDAIEHLARSVGMELPQSAQDNQTQELAPVYEVLAQAAGRYQQWLRQHPAREAAIDYLKRRGLTGEIAAIYGLGFAPSGRENLTRALGNLPLLLKAGLSGKAESGQPYDRFRERVMFPIRDRRGRVIGFGGRVIGSGEPKYLNSPETPVFHKGRELYGLYECLQENPRPAELVVVEGYMDVVALAQYGVRQAVATLGTATSTIQVERLFQVTANVVFCFDGDRAGRAAAARALEAAMPAIREGRQARFLFLPEGEDPDSLVRKEGAEAFTERLRRAKPLSELFFEQLMSGIDMNSMDGRARLAEKAAPGLRKLPPGIFREMMLGRLAELTKVDARQVEAVIAPNERARPRPSPQPVAAQAAIGRRPLRLAIALLLQRPALAALVEQPERYDGVDVPGLPLLAEVLALTRQEPALSTGAILERFRDSPHEAALWKLVAWEHQVPEAGIENEFRGVLGWLDRLLDEKRLQYLDEKLQQQGALTEGELREWQALLAGKRAAPHQS